jgi:hypothetical protein
MTSCCAFSPDSGKGICAAWTLFSCGVDAESVPIKASLEIPPPKSAELRETEFARDCAKFRPDYPPTTQSVLKPNFANSRVTKACGLLKRRNWHEIGT